MKKRISLLSFVILLGFFITLPVLAIDISVEFLEGHLEYTEGRDAWLSAEIGDTLPENCQIRLSGRGYAEISSGAQKVTLTKDGLYQTANLFADEPEKANFRQIVGSKFTSLLRHNESNSGMTVAAVRGAEAEGDDFISWEDESTDYLNDGKALFEEGDIAGAMELFDEGSLWETGAVQRECGFRLGVCQQIIGDPRAARKTLTSLSPEKNDPFLGEYAVTVGTLYIESREYGNADNVLSFYLSANPNGDAAQAAWLLSAFSREGQNDDAGRRESLRKAVNLGPNTEIGRAASSMLQ